MLTPFPLLLLDAHEAVFLLRASACRLGSPCTSAGLLLQGWDSLPLEALSAPVFRLGILFHTKAWAEKEAFGLTSDGDHLYCFCSDTLVNLPNLKAFQKEKLWKHRMGVLTDNGSEFSVCAQESARWNTMKVGWVGNRVGPSLDMRTFGSFKK